VPFLSLICRPVDLNVGGKEIEAAFLQDEIALDASAPVVTSLGARS